ncbi:MAG: hypothetical protein ACEQR5_09955, partial [Moraxellaceae bacterium]
QIKSNVYRIGSILLVGILLICATLLKIFNKQVHTVKGGTTISKEIFGNFPDIFFFTTVFIAVIVTVRLFLRSEK